MHVSVASMFGPNSKIIQMQSIITSKVDTSVIMRLSGTYSVFPFMKCVQHVVVHIEKGNNIYFTPELASAEAINPRETVLTALFKICSNDSFSRTLYNYQVPSYYTWNILIKN